MTHRHLMSWLSDSLEKNADLVALRVRRDGTWATTTYRELDELTTRLAVGLTDLGLVRGDAVAIHAGNCPEWTITDLACMKAGLVSVPVYTTNTPHQIAHVLRDSGARVIFSGSSDLLARVEESLPLLQTDGAEVRRFLLTRDDEAPTEVPTLQQIVDSTPPAADLRERVRESIDQITLDDPVTVVYTSGTTGDPKGVVLTQRTLSHQMEAISDRFAMPRGGRNMSFLPLSHAYERGWSYVVLSNGMENCYVTDPKKVADAMLDIRPVSFVSVPRLYEKIYAGARALADTPVKRRIFDWAIRVGGDVQTRRQEGRPVPRALAAQHVVADRLVLHNVRDVVGGPKAVMAAGGAPLRREVEEFFFAAGLFVYQGYGLTETSPMVACNAPGQVRFGTVGRPVLGTQVRIAAQTGEILVRGDNVTPGYLGRPEETAAAIDDDGWFHTGDVGHIDGDGYLVITDRIKDLIVTTQGKNIAPGPIESALAADPLVEAALVVGDARPYLTALIQPSFEELEKHGRRQGWPVHDRRTLLRLGEVEQYFDQLIGKVGRHAARHERVQKFRVLEEPLSIDEGELTPTLKVRRGPVERRHAHLIAEMYS